MKNLRVLGIASLMLLLGGLMIVFSGQAVAWAQEPSTPEQQQPAPEEQQPAAETPQSTEPQTEEATELPRTASPYPFLAVIGLVGLGASYGFRVLRQHIS